MVSCTIYIVAALVATALARKREISKKNRVRILLLTKKI